MAARNLSAKKKEKAPAPRNCCVYVIDLKKSVLEDHTFMEKNPLYRQQKPAVYVGQSSKTAQERFQQHMAGVKASKWVKKYGKRVRNDEGASGLTRKAAEKLERSLTERLRARGWAVWSN